MSRALKIVDCESSIKQLAINITVIGRVIEESPIHPHVY